MKHTNGTSSVTPAETTLRNVENNITAQSTTSKMVNKTGNCLIIEAILTVIILIPDPILGNYLYCY